MNQKTEFVKRWAVVTCALVVAQSALAFYNPSTGRWLNRDPIREKGGVNIYASLANECLSHVDFLGLNPSIVYNAFSEIHHDFQD